MLDDTYNEADVLSSLKMEMESDVGLDKQGPAANTLGSSFANVYSGLAGLPPPSPVRPPRKVAALCALLPQRDPPIVCAVYYQIAHRAAPR